MSELGFGFEIKSIDEAGYIAGVAAGIGNVDYGNDMILPGVMTKAVAGRASVPMLLFHDHKRPVGSWGKFEEKGEGFDVEGRFAMKSESGREAHALAEARALTGLSIGYKALKHRLQGRVRQLEDLTLHEVSLVPVGMNNRAVITQIKSILDEGNMPTVRQFEDFLRDAGGFSKTLAEAIASKAKPLLIRGEPEGTDELAEYLRALKA